MARSIMRAVLDHPVHSLDFVKVTESAALAASRWMGRGERDAADGAAVEKMREALGEMEISGRIVIGEGERDEAPMLYIGEEVGSGGKEVDIAVDPVEGTNLVANGLAEFDRRDGHLRTRRPAARARYVYEETCRRTEGSTATCTSMRRCARTSKRSRMRSTSRSTTFASIILDRPRHADLIREVRAAGARIRLISDGDVDACIATAIESTGIHVAMGTGGAPEGVLAAAAIKCLGGNFMGRLEPRNQAEAQRAIDMGFGDIDRMLELDDLVRSNDVIFCATGITDGDLVRGVRFFGNQARTHSILVHSSGTVRFIESTHRLGARPDGR